jgi:serine/threonine protein kinase
MNRNSTHMNEPVTPYEARKYYCIESNATVMLNCEACRKVSNGKLARCENHGYLGCGSGGRVYVGMETNHGGNRGVNTTERCVAMKVMPHEDRYGMNLIPEVRREIEMMQYLNNNIDCKYVMNMLDVYYDRDKSTIVLPLLGRDLFTKVKEEGPLDEAYTANIFWQICTALESLHNVNICHLDIKLQNVAFVDHNEDYVKLIDFGLARRHDRWPKIIQPLPDRKFIGTPAYVSPEIIKYARYGPASDVWSLGVVLFSMLQGWFPFAGMSNIRDNNRQKFDENIDLSDDVIDLINRLLNPDLKKRITLRDILSHRWVVHHRELRAEAEAAALAMTQEQNDTAQEVLDCQYGPLIPTSLPMTSNRLAAVFSLVLDEIPNLKMPELQHAAAALYNELITIRHLYTSSFSPTKTRQITNDEMTVVVEYNNEDKLAMFVNQIVKRVLRRLGYLPEEPSQLHLATPFRRITSIDTSNDESEYNEPLESPLGVMDVTDGTPECEKLKNKNVGNDETDTSDFHEDIRLKSVAQCLQLDCCDDNDNTSGNAISPLSQESGPSSPNTDNSTDNCVSRSSSSVATILSENTFNYLDKMENFLQIE